MECTNAFSARVARRRALAIGGIKMSILDPLRSCKRTAGLPIQEYVYHFLILLSKCSGDSPITFVQDQYAAERKEKLQNTMSLYRCHTIFNCVYFTSLTYCWPVITIIF